MRRAEKVPKVWRCPAPPFFGETDLLLVSGKSTTFSDGVISAKLMATSSLFCNNNRKRFSLMLYWRSMEPNIFSLSGKPAKAELALERSEFKRFREVLM
ncbi:hypothetical protein [Arenibacter algicola]|uniref:hypothetical protein n=1 Tax=Arenibacter algicola TaxID=616991 RepID=UPI0011529F71